MLPYARSGRFYSHRLVHMIYLHPSRHIVPPSAGSGLPLEEDYLDKLSKLEGREGRFRLVIEASNGTALQGGIKETLLSARLYAQDGRDLSDALKGLNPYWEVREGETWHEVGRGWTYLVKDSKSLRTLYQVRVSQLDILTALGVTLPNSMQRVLEEIIIAQQITITGWLSMLAQLPSEQLICDRLISSQSFLARVKGEKGDPGKSVTAQEVVQQLNTEAFRGSIRDTLKTDAAFVAATKGLKGEKGQDAAPMRQNLMRRGIGLKPNMGQSSDNVDVTYKGDGVYRVTKHDKMWNTVTMYTQPLQNQKTNKPFTLSWRVVGASRPELLTECKLQSKGGRYYTTRNTARKSEYIRGGVYANPFKEGENHWIDGDWIEFADIKVELIEDGEPLEPTAYIPSIDDLKGEDGESPTPLEVANVINTATWQAMIADQTASRITDSGKHLAKIRNGMATEQDIVKVNALISEQVRQIDTMQLDLSDQRGQFHSFVEESISRQHKLSEEVAVQKESIRSINNQIETQVLDPIRDIRSELLQQESKAQQLIQRFATRHVASLITPQEGANYVVKVPDFYEFDPIVEDGATVSLHVNIKHPNNHCVVALNHDAMGYFFYVRANRDIFSTDAEPLGKNVKVYYNSELCAEQSLAVRLERSDDHWIFLNYRDFAVGIQSESTQIGTQSHYSKFASEQALSYAPFQYLSGAKRDVKLPPARQGVIIKVWANYWVGEIKVRTRQGERLYNTASSDFGDISIEGALIPRGHIGEFACINDDKQWLYTDLSR